MQMDESFLSRHALPWIPHSADYGAAISYLVKFGEGTGA